MGSKKLYQYCGAVMEFENLVAENWRGATMAVSPKKALTNLSYQFRMETGRTVQTKISLDAKKLVEVA